jgi:DNA-binding MarR family transcriptional regulator
LGAALFCTQYRATSALHYAKILGIHPYMSLKPSDIDNLSDALRALPSGLALQHLVALLEVGRQTGLSVNDLADILAIPQQTASRYVAVLSGRYDNVDALSQFSPLIEQRINERDPRRRALFLTDEGREVLNTLLTTIKGNGEYK